MTISVQWQLYMVYMSYIDKYVIVSGFEMVKS